MQPGRSRGGIAGPSRERYSWGAACFAYQDTRRLLSEPQQLDIAGEAAFGLQLVI